MAMSRILDVNRTICDKVWNADRTGGNGILKYIFLFFHFFHFLFFYKPCVDRYDCNERKSPFVVKFLALYPSAAITRQAWD